MYSDKFASSGLPVPVALRFQKRTKTLKKKREVPSFSNEKSDRPGSDVRAQKKLVKRFIPAGKILIIKPANSRRTLRNKNGCFVELNIRKLESALCYVGLVICVRS